MSYAQPNSPDPRMWAGPFEQHRRRRSASWTAMVDETPGTNPAGPDTERDEAPTDRRRGPRGRRGPGHGPGFGPGPWGGRGPWGPPRGRRRERGDVRAAILLLVAEQPRHGYEIITELTERSEGQWAPSPGSVYPVLKRLARDGLVQASEQDGRKVFSLTDAGSALVAQERDAWGEPWAQNEAPESDAAMELFAEGKQLGAAVWQVSQLNDAEQVAQATAILAEARKKIYGLLAR